ncbi:MAG: hydrogenase formation protein HypD [Patescibacteria group bacterium]
MIANFAKKSKDCYHKAMKKYIKEIEELASQLKKPIKLMEVCGTHTQVVAEYGLKNFLPANVELVSGPGCPVCVTGQRDIDAVVELALAGASIFCYGDMMRVPGTKMSLAEAAQRGARVRAVYSVSEIAASSQAPPRNDKKGVFFGIGFETTAPMTASFVKRGGVVYSAHKSFAPAMQALLSSGEINIDGLISPGHVAAITGWRAFDVLRTFDGAQIPQVVAGFELEDVLRAIVMLLRQIVSGEAKTENEYIRVVLSEGNKKAQKLLREVFDLSEGYWRGLGSIPATGFELKKEFAKQDAKVIYKDIIDKVFARKLAVKNKCLCGQVIKGLISSEKCPMFCRECTPDTPQGPCMVSVEGSCYVKYSNR